MADNTPRRGSDFDSLRSRGSAGNGRSPRESEDPLAELARLVSQNEQPRSAAPRSGHAPQPPRASYAPPAVERSHDRYEPRAAQAPSFDPRSYGAADEQGYDSGDFFDDPAPPLRGTSSGFAAYADDDDDGDYSQASRAHPVFHDDFDPDSIYPEGDDHARDLPASRGRGRLIAGALLGVLVIGSVAAWALGGFGGDAEAPTGAPPLIRAENDTPVKVVPQAQPVARAKESYDRVDPNGSATVVPSAEEPGEKPSPRVILPGAPAAGAEERVAEVSPGGATPDQRSNDPNAGRRVKTIAIRPDGSMAQPSEQSSSVQALAEATPPPTIEGIGPAAGMSMQPSRDGGIMASEAPASTPMPTPRPAPPQQRQADPYAVQSIPTAQPRTAPASRPAAGGPPSTPQPQVTLTNKRPLQPSGAPPTAGRQTAMAQPTGPVPGTSRLPGTQVATASGGGFGVQLTAQRSEAEALAAFNALKQRNPAALGAYNATIARADLGDKGVFYRALVPAQTQAEASNLCIQFKSAGVDCIVQRR